MNKLRSVKCIGGPSHGRWTGIGATQKLVAVPDPVDLGEGVKMEIGRMTDMAVTAPRTIYTLRKILTPDGEIEFLAPEKMTDYAAIRIVFDAII